MNFVRVLDDAPDIVTAIQHLHNNLSHTEDFKFISSDGNDEFSCHSLIVSMFSSVLHDHIFGPSSCRFIKVEDVDNIAIENMIRFFYEEDVILESAFDITETKNLADAYEISELGRICIRQLAEINVDISNAIPVLVTSLTFNDTTKESECLSFISDNKETIFASQSFVSLEFENVLDIFVKLRDRNSLTESEFLLSGIRWLETNENVNGKDFLVNNIDVSKIPLNDYLDIIVSSPEFFSNIEISHAIKLIQSNGQAVNKADLYKDAETSTESDHSCKDAETSAESDHSYKDAETSTESDHSYKDAETGTESDHTYKDAETNTEIENTSNLIAPQPQKLKELTVEIISDQCDSSKKVEITAKDDICTRFIVCNEWMFMAFNERIASMEKNASSYKDVDISYEGIYLLPFAVNFIDNIVSPLQYLEVLKAALHFQLEEISTKLVIYIGNIVCFDPLFLDGLKCFKSFQERFMHLLISEPMFIVLHPNFVNCSAYLIRLLLEQDSLKMQNELQLLFATVMWLEARNRQRWHFRSCFLNKIAFENISYDDFLKVLTFYPNFFNDKEKESILNFKTFARKENIEIAQKKLPEWYNFKSRKMSQMTNFF